MCELMVTIPMGRYEELLEIETRTSLLAEYTRREKYSVSRETVSHYLGFGLPVTKNDEE